MMMTLFSNVDSMEWMPMPLIGHWFNLQSHFFMLMLIAMHCSLPLSAGRLMLLDCCCRFDSDFICIS